MLDRRCDGGGNSYAGEDGRGSGKGDSGEGARHEHANEWAGFRDGGVGGAVCNRGREQPIQVIGRACCRTSNRFKGINGRFQRDKLFPFLSKCFPKLVSVFRIWPFCDPVVPVHPIVPSRDLLHLHLRITTPDPQSWRAQGGVPFLALLLGLGEIFH